MSNSSLPFQIEEEEEEEEEEKEEVFQQR